MQDSRQGQCGFWDKGHIPCSDRLIKDSVDTGIILVGLMAIWYALLVFFL